MKHTSHRPHWWLWLAVAAIGASGPIQAASPIPALETKDTVQARVGVFRNGAGFTAPGGGHTGQAADYAADFATGAGPVVVQDGAFLNEAAANDEMSFAFWIKNFSTSGNSAFWGVSPSSIDGERGWQAHVPWADNTIYFDTAGCCGADTQRINGSIENFSEYTWDLTWWTENWHFFVFSKKAEIKQVWIDGLLFLEGSNTSPLPTDFTALYIGARPEAQNVVHGLIDDFAVFGTALDEATIGQLHTGTLPTALPAGAKLMAFWDFNDYPAEGVFLSLMPAADAPAAPPDLIEVVHLDGVTPWAEGNVSLTVDGADAPITLIRDGTKVTVRHVPSPLLAMESKHKAVLTYPGTAGPKTIEWEFTVGTYVSDAVASRFGVLMGGSSLTGDAGGHTGQSGDRAVDFGRGTGPVHIANAAFLNEATANDEMTFALWIKLYDNANNSAFWANSPSSSGTRRGWQAHIPNGNNIYFDTAGCCDANNQRINASITTFSGYTDLTWWNGWHFFVFSKKAEVKQIWIDGLWFLEGYNYGVLPTDITDLFLGSDGGGTSLMHGLIDDFAVFGTALSDTTINELYTGTLPTALPAADKLVAYWNFNDVSPDGIFVSFTPAPDATDGAPNLVEAVHAQGSSPWDLDKVGLRIDGVAVAPQVVRDAGRVTVRYVPSPIFAQKSVHTATLVYPKADGTLAERSWQFAVAAYTLDTLHQHLGVLSEPAQFTADGGGRTGQVGDYGIDFGQVNAGQSVHVADATFLNAATANDEMAVGAWQKLYSIANSSLFWGVSPSSSGTQRGWTMQAPWSNNTLYFDTAGCCDAATQRISQAMTTDLFPPYSGDVSWWQDWHYLLFQKKLSTKEIWIDGELFLTADNTAPLPTDFTEAYFGYDAPDNASMLGIIDDMAIFKTALDETTVKAIFNGTKPTALPAEAGLIAFWDFNDPPPAVRPTLIVTRSENQLTITSDPQPLPAGFVLQTAPSVLGPWTTQQGANTPITVPIGNEQAVFLRAAVP